LNKLQIFRSFERMFLCFILLENGMYSNNIRFLRKKTVQEQKKMKEKYRSHTSKKFNKHHHHEEFLLLKSINEKEALCPSCNHPLSGHKIRIFQMLHERKKRSKKSKTIFDLTSTLLDVKQGNESRSQIPALLMNHYS